MTSQVNPNLSEEQKSVLFENATEMAGSGKLLAEKRSGVYSCVNCGAELFRSEDKYQSKTLGLIGWPSFGDVAKNDSVVIKPDDSLSMHRTEVSCANCGGHLGHLFTGVDDHPSGNHYCINSCTLQFSSKNQ